ncbi:MAG: RHS repeat-associated core domain-containing protein, partial [Candidatus Parabeggiatoa sp.]|nr:RHS repeat-associated core domain-containing protein [Candidatus Parabeggiatoa sp.]
VTATDRAGNISRQENSFRVNAPDDTSPPELVIHSPEDGTEITAPTDFVATIADDSLVSWQLAVKSVSNPGLTILGSGSDPIANQPIATFDPTMLTNGLYQVIFQAVDANGRSTGISNTYRVAGDLKVGNFSFTVEDISVDMMGIPLKVLRTYDTRRKGEALYFGQGWSINYQSIKVEESRVPGKYWTVNTYGRKFSQKLCIEPLGSNQVTVTLPSGQVEAFEVGTSPSCQTAFQGISRQVQVVFKPVNGTFSQLESLDADANIYFDGNSLLEPMNDMQLFNPSRYKLTTQAGYEYELDENFGIKSLKDPNDNTLTYTAEGIIHSAGKSILFTRDFHGRITKITDPSGNNLKYQYNTSGDLVGSTDAIGNTVRYTYNSTHAMTDIIDPLGQKMVRNLYDDDGRMTGQIDADGNRTNFNHNLKGRQSLVTDKLGRVTQLYYGGRGNVITQVDPLGNISYSTYDQFGNQISAIDPLGNATFFKYDDKFNLLEEKDAEGNVVKYTYTKKGQEKTLTDARGNTFENIYDFQNDFNLVKIKDPLGNEIKMTWDKGQVTSVRDALGNVTHFTYDKSGNKLLEKEPLGNTKTYTYDDNGNQLSYSRKRTDASGNKVVETTFYEYDKRNRLIQTTDPLGNKTKKEYNTLGQESARIDALGRRTEYAYDVDGNLTETRYPDGTKDTRSYDAEGNLLSITDAAGQTTRYEYDKLDRQIKVIYSDGSFSQTEYDAASRVVAQIDENGNRTEFKYDKVGRRIQTKNALGQITTNAYDASGNLVSQTDSNGNTITYQYSALDQQIKTIYPGNLVKENVYDKAGHLVGEKDLAGRETQYKYDAVGRLTEVLKFLSEKPVSTTFAYDEVGNRISQTDANQNTTTWTYDKLGRVLSRTLPLGMTETFVYDKKTGNLLSHTDFNGKTSTFSYDPNNDRLLSSTYADEPVTKFTYNTVGNRLTTSTSNGTTSYSYDKLHRLVKEVKPNQAILEYGYDKLGNRTLFKFTEPTGTAAQVQYQYDKLNRLKKVIAPDGETIYSYDAVGNRQQVVYANGTKTRYAYDKLNRLTSLETRKPDNSLLASYQYTLLPTGHRSQIVEHSGRVINYTYDDLYRLKFDKISTADSDVVFSYQYDAVGNRVYSIEDGVHTKYTYDTNDRLLKQGGFEYEYDDNGNSIRITEENQAMRLSYDGNDRLISIITEENGQVTSTITYAYDAEGDRVQTNASGQVTQYVVDSNDRLSQVIAELDKEGQVRVAYLHGDDLISQYRGNDIHYYHYDGLGSTRGLTDQNATVSDAYNYEAFGGLLEQTGEIKNNYLYTGEQIDPNTGNYYLRARYYNPVSGRFLSMDSFAGIPQNPITLHKYLYANADPLNHTDPSGKFSIGSMSASFKIAGILTRLNTLANTISTTHDVFKIATGQKKLSAKELGTAVVVSLIGAAGKGIIKKLAKKAEKNPQYVNLANAQRTFHILYGEGKGSGGHMWTFKTLFNGKSKFPVHWRGDRIMHAVSDVATSPNSTWKQQTGANGSMYTKAGNPSKFVVEGVSDGIKIRVIVEPAGRGIVTAFPIK